MQARRVDGVLDVHAEVDDVEHDLEHGVDDRAPARAARSPRRACRPSRRWTASCSTACACRARRGSGSVPISPVRSVRPGPVEVAHLVVEQESGTRHDGAEPVAVLEGVGDGDGHAVLVDDGEVRRLVALVLLGDLRRRRGRGAIVEDGAPELRRVRLAQEPVERRRREVGIAEVLRAIEEGAAHLELPAHRRADQPVCPQPHPSDRFPALLVATATGFQFNQMVRYKNLAAYQKELMWQLVWRAPDLEPGTTIFAYNLPQQDYLSGNAITTEIQWTYSTTPVSFFLDGLMIF